MHEESNPAAAYLDPGVTVQIRHDIQERLRDYFDRYDLDESGLIDSESELNLLVTNVGFFAHREHGIEVPEETIDEFIAAQGPKLEAEGMTFVEFVNGIVPLCKLDTLPPMEDQWSHLAIGGGADEVEDKDGDVSGSDELLSPSSPKGEEVQLRLWSRLHKRDSVTVKIRAPFDDPNFYLMDAWLEDQGCGPDMENDCDPEFIERAKVEYLLRGTRIDLQKQLADIKAEWREAARNEEPCEAQEALYWSVEEELGHVKFAEKKARRMRMAYSRCSVCIPGFSCLELDNSFYKTLNFIRTNPYWQWTMLMVNIVNVLGLMLNETNKVERENSNFQSNILPAMDYVANVMFTIDMVMGMIVLGLSSYFKDYFNCLDFFVVVTGWLDVADVGLVDFSAFRVLRVLRPLRLIRYFEGIKAIIGSIVYGWELILNVLLFMCFFLLVFGILGIENFGGALRHRCVVNGPASAGYIAMGPDTKAFLTIDSYNSNQTDLWDPGECGESLVVNPAGFLTLAPPVARGVCEGSAGTMGEFELWCSTGSMGFTCPENMYCDTWFGNPHDGRASFDNFFYAFVLQFQVQTLSTWYEYGYMTQDSIGWISQFYYIAIIAIVGFVVAQLFISVVCFGFESLADQLEKPIFSAIIVQSEGEDDNLDDDDNNLCNCGSRPHPLDDLWSDADDLGINDGIRVNVTFKVQLFPPGPLDIDGEYPPDHLDGSQLTVQKSPLLQTGSGRGSGSGSGAATGAVALVGEDTASMPGVGSGGVEMESISLTGVAPEDTPERIRPASGFATVFEKYQDFGKRVQEADKHRKEEEKNRPFEIAAKAEDLEFEEIEFAHSELKVWSNQNVIALKHMLYEQEQICDEQEIYFFRERPEMADEEDRFPQSEEILPTTEKIQNLLPSWPVCDEAGIPDPITIPQISIQVNFDIKVDISLLTHPEIEVITLHLKGAETIQDIEDMVLEKISEHLNLSKPSMETRMNGESLIPKEWSLWKTCKKEVEEFKQCSSLCVTSAVEMVMTLDKMESFISSKLFDNIIMAAIAANTVFLAIEHYDSADWFNTMQEAAEWVFNVIFICEMICKIVCLKGFGNYIRPFSNKFDFLIVMSSIVQIIVDAVMSGGADQLSILKLFRIFRALRVARMLRKFESVRKILDAALGSMQPILNIFMFLLLILIVFGCLGMQLYGDNFNFDDGKPFANFDDFLQAFYSLFQVVTGSAWELVMFDCMRAQENAGPYPGIVGFMYAIVFFLLSNYIILNLFIGAILANMGTDTDSDRLNETASMKEKYAKAQFRSRSAQIFSNSKFTAWARSGKRGDLATMEEVMNQDFALDTFVSSDTPAKRFGQRVDNKSFFLFDPYHPARRFVYDLVKNTYFDLFILLIILVSTVLLALDNPTTRQDPTWVNLFTTCDDVFLIIFTIEFLLKIFAFGMIWTDNIEFMLADQECLKALVLGDVGEPAYMYSGWNYLDMIVLAVGFILKFGNPEGPLKILRLLRAFRPLRMVNRIAGMKLVLGALVAACPALANVCFLMCAVFLIFSILGLSLFMGKFHFCTDEEAAGKDDCFGEFESEDGFPMPSVWKNPSLDGFYENSFDNVASSFLVLFEVATGDSWETVLDLITMTRDNDNEQPQPDSSRIWGMYLIIFVFVGQLFMLQLFVSVIIDSFNFAEGSGLLTGEQALFSDMRKLNDMLQPEPKAQPAAETGWRRVCYDMFMDCEPQQIEDITHFMELKRVPNNESMLKQDAEKSKLAAFLMDMKDPKYQDNKRVLEIMQKEVQKMEAQVADVQIDINFCDQFSVSALTTRPPPTGWQYVVGKYFDSVITLCICGNIFFMCTTHEGESDNWKDVKKTQNLIFLSVFIFEFVLKHCGLGFQAYWSDPFNAFDGIVVLVSILFVIVPGGAIAGLFRIGRVFRLIKRAPQLRALMTSMLMTVPSISNVFAVMLLLFFIFAVIGVELFGKLRYGFAINQDNNYGTWIQSMLALWRATLGNWRSNMYDAAVEAPFCTSGYSQLIPYNFQKQGNIEIDFTANDCGSAFASVGFHVIFQFFSTFAVLNVVIAIILGAFTWCYALEQSELTSDLPVTADDLRHFKMIWDRFDLYGSGEMDVERLQLFLAVVRSNIPKIFYTGVQTQSDEMLYIDYSSFQLSVDYAASDKESERMRKERKSYENFTDLIARIGDFERSAEVWKQLDMAGCDIWMGNNDNVAGFDIMLHPLGSTDGNLHIFTKEINNGIIYVPMYSDKPVPTRVDRVRFISLINILVMDPLNLSEHDVYVCFDYKDPFSYFQPGYFGDKYPNTTGQVELNMDPESIRMPYEKPAYFKRIREKLTEDDLAGTYTVDKKSGAEKYAEYIADDDKNGQPNKKRLAVVTSKRGV